MKENTACFGLKSYAKYKIICKTIAFMSAKPIQIKSAGLPTLLIINC